MDKHKRDSNNLEVKTMRIFRFTRAKRAALIMSALAFLILLSGSMPALTESAGKLRKINVSKEGDHLYVKLTGTTRFRYRVKTEENPPRMTIQLYDTTAELGYNSLNVNEGYVKDVKIQESTINGQRATFVIIHLNQNVAIDYGLSGDGRTLYVSTPTYAGAGKGSVSQYSADSNSQEGNIQPASKAKSGGGDIGLPPEITVPGNAPSIKPAPSEMVPYSASSSSSSGNSTDFSQSRGPDNSPYIVGPIILQDADVSKAMQLLSEAAGGASIIIESKVIEESAQSAGGGGTSGGAGGESKGGITMTLSHMTLEDALDVITSANDWIWKKIAGSYVIISRDTANKGLNITAAASVYDVTNQAIQVTMYKPKYLDACTLLGYVTYDVPNSKCDQNLNWLMLKGRFEDIERAKAILAKVDTSKALTEPTTEKKLTDRLIDKTGADLVTHIVRLKYIRAKDLQTQLQSLMANPFFGNLSIVTSRVGGEKMAANETSMNTLSIDEGSNTLVFVGREEIFRRLQQVVQQLDVPFSATIMRTVQLKNAQVEDFKNDMGTRIASNLGREVENSNSLMYNNTSNTITYIGTEDNYNRLMQLIQSYDTEDKAVITETLPFSKTKAIEVVKSGILNILAGSPQYGYLEFWDGSPNGGISTGSSVSGTNRTRLTVHIPTNSFIITAQKQYMDRVKEFLKALDIDTQDLKTKMIKLKHINGIRAVAILDGMLRVSTEGSKETKVQMDGGFWECGAPASGGTCTTGLGSTFFNTLPVSNDDPNAKYSIVSIYYESIQNALLIKANDVDFKRITDILNMVDVPYPQIKIEVQIVAITDDDLKDIKRSVGYQDGKFTMDNLETSAMGFAYDTASNFTAQFLSQINMLISTNRASLISNPTIITRENVSTSFSFTDTFMYKTTTTQVTSGVAITTETPNSVTYGPQMTLRAHLNTEENTVLLHIMPDYTTFQGLNADGLPITSASNMDQEVIVKSGETLISSGYITNTESEGLTKIPILGSLPLIGNLFRSKTNSKINKQVLFLITPTILPAI